MEILLAFKRDLALRGGRRGFLVPNNDRVFAKIKGWPPWPAKVLHRAEGKAETYLIQFYGTYDTSIVKPDCIFVYNDENKVKYGKTKNSNRWKEAMEEIENNIPIGDAGPITEEEEVPEAVEADADTDGDGELMIDEGPAGPPVLTKEVSKVAAKDPANLNGKAEQPKGRRGSKASLSKRDSISSTSSITEVTTPSASAGPATEMVSRSGRKIKPKRFADDEIASPVTAIGKAAAALSSQDEEGPPTKRAKRAPKTPPAAKTPPTPVEPKETPPPTRARMVIGKGKGAPAKQQGRLSPDISSPIPKAPALKPAATAPAAQRRSEAGAAKKALPALIPAAAPVTTTPQPVAAPTPPPTRRAPTLRQQPKPPQPEIVTDEEESLTESPPVLAINSEEVEADDKENVKDSAASSNDSEGESESEMEKNSEIDETSSRYSEMEAMDDTKIAFNDKEGELFELRIEAKTDFETEEDRIEYENTIGAVEKIKEDLEQGDAETHETLQELLDANKDEYDPEDAANRERRAIQIRLLRMEGEVIEIIGEIVSCLSEKQAECYRALELLERLGSHDLTPLILKKHPEVVQTVARLRNYIGNVDNWEMNDDQLLEFKESAEMIRTKASDIYNNFYNIFIAPEEQDPTVPFEEIFEEEMKFFRKMTEGLTLDGILGLTGETPEGGFEMFELGEIEA
ncbi:Hepatoma-derived growth factor [Orchesella cincta]|uniref:Hepatoma-derived growth factor n=1 Tax=Orchesella cincta TaxID=48709 RepID=A0A1D2MUP0_ORCCI|nr:Hepatoma-derived growth factor [Orchesella cincta]